VPKTPFECLVISSNKSDEPFSVVNTNLKLIAVKYICSSRPRTLSSLQIVEVFPSDTMLSTKFSHGGHLGWPIDINATTLLEEYINDPHIRFQLTTVSSS
jgi:hypothetical protein